MVKQTQTIGRQIADELFECVWPFCGLALKGLIGLSTLNIKNKGITLIRWICLHITVKGQEQS